MAEIDYRDIPAPGMGVGAGMLRAMRRSEPAAEAVRPRRTEPNVAGPAPRRPLAFRLVDPAGDFTPEPAAPAAPEAPARDASASARPLGERAQRVVNGAGALVSVVLVAGLAWWGYRLAVRDVTGIPVIRALDGPARIAPEDPGGELARHQGLSVNDVTADGTAAPAPDRLVLAPRPEGLSDEDVAMSALAEGAGVAGAALSIAPAESPVEPLTGEPLGPDGVIADPALVPSGAVGPGAPEPRPIPRPGTRAAMARGAAAMPEMSAAAAAASVDGVQDAEIVAALAAAEASIAPQVTEEIDAAALPPGTRLVQIDTYDSVEAARAGWDVIADAFPDVMTGKRRVIEPAGNEGTPFFRLRAEGFADVEDARRFCSVLMSRVPTCVPALVK